ncbi:site-2 protease family protein, partial [Enterococcus faecium]
MKTILTFIIVFGILVIVHEFGHFFFAKRSGILV